MEEQKKDGRDEMNLAVLPIALLGRNDKRDVIEYYGTFREGEKQESMVWTVRGAAGLPTEFAERVLVALLHIGAQNDFASRRLEFSTYQILTILGHTLNGRNYKAVETALIQLAGVLITSDKAWIEKKKDGTQKRITTKRGFHIIDEYYLRCEENEEEEEGDKSYIVWGARLWRNLQAGYIRRLDIDFYYSIDLALARRLYRFLDKVTHYKPYAPYAIDIFDLANKLGLAQYEYASQVKRLLSAAADELVERSYLSHYEFFKVGKFVRVRFCRCKPSSQMMLSDDIDGTNKKTIEETNKEPDPDPLAELWATIVEYLPDDHTPKKLEGTRLVSIEDGTATIAAGAFCDWVENRLGNRILKALQRERDDVTAVHFVA